MRRSLLGLAVVAQAFVVVSAVAWWTAAAASTPSAAADAPVGWDSVVDNVGLAGVNLRSAPEVMPGTARRTVAQAAHLQIVCGVTGDAVSHGTVRTATWLKTNDGLYVSGLYVHIVGKNQIASCPQQDLPLIPVPDAAADPADTTDPPVAQARNRTVVPTRDGSDDDPEQSAGPPGAAAPTGVVGTGTTVALTPTPSTSGTAKPSSSVIGSGTKTSHRDDDHKGTHHDPDNAGKSVPAG